jgi:hypothetical protein
MDGIMEVTIDEFMASLISNGEKSGWKSQNAKTGAYGKFQILPGNWKVWAPRALMTDKEKAVAAKDISPLEWRPRPTQVHQYETARWRIMESYEKHGNWQDVAAMWQSGNADPQVWKTQRRTCKYVNRVCVPLGYAPVPVPPAPVA